MCVIRVKWIVGTEVQCKCDSLCSVRVTMMCSVRVNMMEGRPLVTIGQKATDQIRDSDSSDLLPLDTIQCTSMTFAYPAYV